MHDVMAEGKWTIILSQIRNATQTFRWRQPINIFHEWELKERIHTHCIHILVECVRRRNEEEMSHIHWMDPIQFAQWKTTGCFFSLSVYGSAFSGCRFFLYTPFLGIYGNAMSPWIECAKSTQQHFISHVWFIVMLLMRLQCVVVGSFSALFVLCHMGNLGLVDEFVWNVTTSM